MLKRILTADGSPTLCDIDSGLTYRSIKGAKTESEHVFINGTNLAQTIGAWSIWELGLGPGTNFKNARSAAPDNLFYCAVETSPVPAELCFDPMVAQISRMQGRIREVTDAGVTLRVIVDDWRNVSEVTLSDAVFHDPFGPQDNPECWTESCFRWQGQRLKQSGCLATFSSAGHVRRAMIAAGLSPRKVTGPPGKRHVTVATLESRF